MVEGRIELSGGKDLALELEEKGYDWVRDDISRTRRSPKKEIKHGQRETRDHSISNGTSAISPTRKRIRSMPASA